VSKQVFKNKYKYCWRYSPNFRFKEFVRDA